MQRMKFFVGTSGFSYKEWKGRFYPRDFSPDQMLPFYAEHFGAVEINNTFYRMPQPTLLRSWAAQVPADFKFTLKAPQRITHFRRLKDAAQPLREFLRVAGTLKKRLGPILFGLPPNFKKDLPRLAEFLRLLPKDKRFAFEFRHQSWMDEDVFELLHKHRVALCIAEAEDGIQAPLRATADWGYLRLRRPDYGDPELRAWVKRVQEQDWQDAYVFFKHEDEGKGPKLAARFIELCA